MRIRFDERLERQIGEPKGTWWLRSFLFVILIVLAMLIKFEKKKSPNEEYENLRKEFISACKFVHEGKGTDELLSKIIQRRNDHLFRNKIEPYEEWWCNVNGTVKFYQRASRYQHLSQSRD